MSICGTTQSCASYFQINNPITSDFAYVYSQEFLANSGFNKISITPLRCKKGCFAVISYAVSGDIGRLSVNINNGSYSDLISYYTGEFTSTSRIDPVKNYAFNFRFLLYPNEFTTAIVKSGNNILSYTRINSSSSSSLKNFEISGVQYSNY